MKCIIISILYDVAQILRMLGIPKGIFLRFVIQSAVVFVQFSFVLYSFIPIMLSWNYLTPVFSMVWGLDYLIFLIPMVLIPFLTTSESKKYGRITDGWRLVAREDVHPWWIRLFAWALVLGSYVLLYYTFAHTEETYAAWERLLSWF